MRPLKAAVLLFPAWLGLLSAGIVMLPEENILPDFYLNPREENIHLRFLYYYGRALDTGKIGFRLPVIGAGKWQGLLSGTVKVYMFPESGTFAVDRFWAVLGAGTARPLGGAWSMVFYPLYHLSAHLADGHESPAGNDSRVISHESMLLRFYADRKGLTVPLEAAWYWHSSRSRLKAHAGTGLQYTIPLAGNGPARASVLFCGYGYTLWRDEILTLNSEVSAGILVTRKQRSLRICLYWEDQDGQGQDFDKRQSSWGVEVGIR